ncbi:hypothetical protein PR202_ga03676 [Eleusine coracana subsp. coracana]|uniref:Uncharacterized protein n=1 Tax=Eleusine coracana subsp. coracana TaxID=191504 RepID=A0AAV5BPZ2_ELECO|nr:hypothetical protein PR202_ga03676 [Eleusine coracana subsp. coracana]
MQRRQLREKQQQHLGPHLQLLLLLKIIAVHPLPLVPSSKAFSVLVALMQRKTGRTSEGLKAMRCPWMAPSVSPMVSHWSFKTPLQLMIGITLQLDPPPLLLRKMMSAGASVSNVIRVYNESLRDTNHRTVLSSVFMCRRVQRFWSARKLNGQVVPPSPTGLPIIGNLHQLVWGHHHRTLQALAQRHGPLFLIHLGFVPTVVVSSASMAEAVLKTQDHVCCGRPQQYTARGMLWDCRTVGFSTYGERWRQLRRIAVVHLLSSKKVETFRTLREEEVASFIGRIQVASQHDNDGHNKGPCINLTDRALS